MIKLDTDNYKPIIKKLNRIQSERNWNNGCSFTIFDTEAKNYAIVMEIDHTMFKTYHNEWLKLTTESGSNLLSLNILDSYLLEIIKSYLPELAGNDIIIEHLIGEDERFIFREFKSVEMYNFVEELLSKDMIFNIYQNVDDLVNRFNEDFFCTQYLRTI